MRRNIELYNTILTSRSSLTSLEVVGVAVTLLLQLGSTVTHTGTEPTAQLIKKLKLLLLFSIYYYYYFLLLFVTKSC